MCADNDGSSAPRIEARPQVNSSEPDEPGPPQARDGSRADQPAVVIALGRRESVQLTAYGVVLLFLGVGVFSAVADVDTSTAKSLLMVGVFLATMVLHELVHGLCFRLFGGSPRFGVGISFILPYLSTTSQGDRFNARQMSMIGLAPLVSLSIGTLVVGGLWPSLAPYALVGFLANFSGSVGDLWLVAHVRRFARLENVSFEDRKTGVAVWTDDKDAHEVLETLEEGTNTATRFATRFAVATVAIFLVTIVIGVIATFTLPRDEVFRIGPAVLPLFEKQPADEGLLVTFKLGPPVVGGLLFAVLASGLQRRHPSPTSSMRRRVVQDHRDTRRGARRTRNEPRG